MKITKAVRIFTLNVLEEDNNPAFFNRTLNKTLYFKSIEEAQSYQKKYHPAAIVNTRGLLAVADKDKLGNERWVLLETYHINYDNYSYKLSDVLRGAIDDNPESIIAVYISMRATAVDTDQNSRPNPITELFTVSDFSNQHSKFIYANRNGGHSFVTRGQEICLTCEPQLMSENKLTEQHDPLIDGQQNASNARAF